MAKTREMSQIKIEKPLVCLCGKNHHDIQSQDELDMNPDEIQDTDGIFIENTPEGARFRLCPACNPQVNCRFCAGTGHKTFTRTVVLETEEGNAEYNSVELRPNACSCRHLEILVQKLNAAKIPDKYIHAELNSFQFNHLPDKNLRQKLADNINLVMQFCDRMSLDSKEKNEPNQKYFMTLFGPVGSGKTLLATAALKKLISSDNRTGKFVDFQYLLSELRAEYDVNKTGETLLNELRRADVLLIDEFGKGRNDKEWQLEKLDDLVNYRYNAKKITFITTNYLPQNYKYDDKDIPYTRNKDLYANDTPINESFWQQSLSERIGMRMYERILEVSEFVDFTDLPSYRKFLGKSFLDLYINKNANNNW